MGKQFGGPAIMLDRNDINTDEIIPAKYLTEITKVALGPHLLEDLLVDGEQFDSHSPEMKKAKVVITRANFGCGSSREHAVWAFEVNDVNVVVAESFARIFRQNMFNCGILAIELSEEDIDRLFGLGDGCTIMVNLNMGYIVATKGSEQVTCQFELNQYDKDLVAAGGWLAFAEENY